MGLPPPSRHPRSVPCAQRRNGTHVPPDAAHSRKGSGLVPENSVINSTLRLEGTRGFSASGAVIWGIFTARSGGCRLTPAGGSEVGLTLRALVRGVRPLVQGLGQAARVHPPGPPWPADLPQPSAQGRGRDAVGEGLAHAESPDADGSRHCACTPCSRSRPGAPSALVIPWEDIGAAWDEARGRAGPSLGSPGPTVLAPGRPVPRSRLARGPVPPGGHAHSSRPSPGSFWVGCPLPWVC